MEKVKEVTQCFTYEVRMIVHVIADSEESAKTKLDTEGGVMTNRETSLITSVPLKNELEKK
jgi:hypothetical protein